MNILSMIREQLSPDLVGKLGRSLGESPEDTKSALEHSLPALLGSAAAGASSPEGATNLFNTLKQKTPQGGWSDSASSLLNGLGSTGGLGTSLVSSLLGSKMNMIRDFIARRSGVRAESASSVMGYGSQLLMGILGKQVLSQGLGASGLGQLLQSQIPHLQGLLPPDLANMVGLGNLVKSNEPAVQSRSYAAPPLETTPAAPSGGRVLAWAAIPVALLLAGLFLYRHNRQTDMGGTRDETYTARNISTGTSLALPTVNIAGFTDQMKAAITKADATPVPLQGVSFDTTGNLLGDAKARLSSLGTMLNDNSTLKATITTYGESIEEATSRANAIKSSLTRAGISTERITTQPELGAGLPTISFSK